MTKIIITASATPVPTRFRLWDRLSLKDQAKVKALMQLRGNLDWTPGDVIEVESFEEIEQLMRDNQGVLIGGKK